MPSMPGSLSSTAAAASATSSHVGLAGIVTPCLESTSLRYMRKELSP